MASGPAFILKNSVQSSAATLPWMQTTEGQVGDNAPLQMLPLFLGNASQCWQWINEHTYNGGTERCTAHATAA